MIEFVIATHNLDILQQNIGRSKVFLKKPYLFHIKKGYTNIPDAYNDTKPLSSNTQFICYLHHDVFLPPSFEEDLNKAIKNINLIDPNWGVLGVAGAKLVSDKKQSIGHILDRGREWGSRFDLPQEVDTLDEVLLVTHGELQFDRMFEQDFYGADICMQAKIMYDKKSYAIDAYIEHNSSRKIGERTVSFYRSEKRFRIKYDEYLPIVTTCALIN